MRPSRLIADAITISRGERRLIAGLSFAVAGGEALVLTGPNGVGKTSLLRCIAGLLPQDAGSVHLEGGDADHPVGEQCHLIGHANATKAGLSVRENLDFWARFLGLTDQSIIESALDRLGLDALSHVPAAYLSAGQRRRLGLARLLAAPRPLWLLDEPTVSLDEHARRVLAAMMREHLEAGGMIIAATHLPLGLDNARTLDLGALASAGGGA